MQNILIGDDVSEHIFILSRKLKDSAITQFQAKGKDVPSYVPWIAAGSDIDFDFPEDLFSHPALKQRGTFVNELPYLRSAKSYLEVSLARIKYHPGLMPGPREDWLPDPVTRQTTIDSVLAGIEVLRAAGPAFENLYNELVEFVMPLGDKHRGYSNCTMRGVIFRGFPDNWNPYDVAIDLAHELGHHSLFVWQSIDNILTTPVDAPVFSSVRKDDRPAIQSFHGAVALAFMLSVTQKWPQNDMAREVKARHGSFYVGGTLETALSEALDTLRVNCQFTPVGARMIEEMQALLIPH